MRTVLPGKPQAKLQAVTTAQWLGKRLIAYISGNALVILGGPHDLIQTTYHDQCEELDAVIIDETSGKIATCSSDEIYVYKPYGREEGVPKWSLHLSLSQPDGYQEILTLSWGSEEELLVGFSGLRLHQTAKDNGRVIWDRKLKYPVMIASFSYDATLIASTGWHDRLVKLWRRQSFGLDDTRFDFTYLPHPTAITAIHWRRIPYHEHHRYEQRVDDVLFSICVDGKIRIWTSTDPHELQVMRLWAEIDMQLSLQPRRFGGSALSNEHYAFFIDSQVFTAAAASALEANAGNKDEVTHAIEHLREVAKMKSDVCVVLDRRGNMSAWGLDNVGCRVRKPTDIFNVAHLEDISLPFVEDAQGREDNVQFFNFSNEQSPSPFTLLIHHFDGRITWHESNLDELFDPSPRANRFYTRALWTGHNAPIRKIVRNGSGKALISRTDDSDGLVWKQNVQESAMLLIRQASLVSNEHIYRSCVVKDGDFILNLHLSRISLWNTQSLVAQEVASCALEPQSRPLTLLLIPTASPNSHIQYVAAITSKMSGILWEILLPPDGYSSPPLNNDVQSASIKEFCTFDVGTGDEMVTVLPIDPAGHASAAPSFLALSAKNVALSYDKSGTLYGWSASVDSNNYTIKWLVTTTVCTNIRDPSLAGGSSTGKVGLVDASKTNLTIWDMRNQHLEYDIAFGPQDTLQDLDWSLTPDQQSILAVGFRYQVSIIAQMRYDYLDAGSAWAPVREIRIRELTSHPIADSVWLGNGNFIVAAGSQLYVYDEDVSISDDMVVNLQVPIHKDETFNIFDLVSYLNGPLPLYHPQFLVQIILAGYWTRVARIVLALYEGLKFFMSGDELDSHLSLPLENFITGPEEEPTRTSSYTNAEGDEGPKPITEDMASTLNGLLKKLVLPYLTTIQQIHLASIIESVAVAEKQKQSMDSNAMRYHIFFSQHMLRKRHFRAKTMEISWREIVWASHSNCQDILVDLVSRQYHGRILWEHARESGMFMWLTELTALRAQFETIARNEYTKTDEKNPVNCSLYYLALKKKNVLLGLWRMAAWHREQTGTQRLLKNNFSEARWKTAALKNAYALLGKRRFEYAAAWFLLAGNLQDAVNICAHQIEDLQLAIAVARVYEGDESPVLRSLLTDKVLPQAAAEGNRWLATWAFWQLRQRHMAVRALIEPLSTLIKLSHIPDAETKSFLVHEPALIVLYKQLREKSLQPLKGALGVSSQAEWEFVIRSARQYDRMGCGLLALDLVRNWRFLSPSTESTADPLKQTRRRESLIQEHMPDETPTASHEKLTRKPAPTIFKEPEPSSLLDSFGF
ncbi:MAG: hypothetical protein Q9163_001133 [Psora crenata]